jgi:hypothetical protein
MFAVLIVLARSGILLYYASSRWSDLCELGRAGGDLTGSVDPPPRSATRRRQARLNEAL